MAILGRLELPAYGLGNRRSIRLSYGTAPPDVSQPAGPCLLGMLTGPTYEGLAGIVICDTHAPQSDHHGAAAQHPAEETQLNSTRIDDRTRSKRRFVPGNSKIHFRRNAPNPGSSYGITGKAKPPRANPSLRIASNATSFSWHKQRKSRRLSIPSYLWKSLLLRDVCQVASQDLQATFSLALARHGRRWDERRGIRS